jgi:hypothetical protein
MVLGGGLGPRNPTATQRSASGGTHESIHASRATGCAPGGIEPSGPGSYFLLNG